MTKEFIFVIPLCVLFVNGTFTCMESDWVLDGSKCLKTISGSPEDGQAQCSIEVSSAALMLAPTNTAATNIAAKFPSENIWVGLRFLYGANWTWDGGSLGSITSGDKTTEPQLCIGVFDSGLMYDNHCFSKSGVICERNIDGSGICDLGWDKIGTMCYKRLRASNNGLRFNDAKILCSIENAYIMMPQSEIEAKSIKTTLNCGTYCWVGITDFDADHIYTWENGFDEIQSNLYFGSNEPNHRDQHYMCAYIQDGLFNNGECADTKKVICEIDAMDSRTTTDFIKISTKSESTSADIHTAVHTVAATTNPTSMAESKITIKNPTIVPVTIMSVSLMVCIDKCTSYCSEYINGSVDARQNVPYRVDRKSLSSYRRSHRSEPDPRMSSLYIGCVGCVILIMTVLFIIMLDFLPSA